MLGQCHRRWPNIRQPLGECFLFVGLTIITCTAACKVQNIPTRIRVLSERKWKASGNVASVFTPSFALVFACGIQADKVTITWPWNREKRLTFRTSFAVGV